MEPFDLHVACSLDEALALLATTGGRPVAGATDLIPAMRAGRVSPRHLVDISRLREWRYITRGDDGWIHLGALVTHADLVSSPLIQQAGGGLWAAATSLGGPQTRVRGTLGGNLANASPAADVGTALVGLDAAITLVSSAGERRLPLRDFFTGPGMTVLQPAELIKEVAFRPVADLAGGAFLKMGLRRSLAIAVVNVGVTVRLDGDRIGEAIIAIGAAAPTIVRAEAAEAVLVGAKPTPAVMQQAGELAALAIRPIDDLRATAAYRRAISPVLVRRALTEAIRLAHQD